jgi:hypothetical protein
VSLHAPPRSDFAEALAIAHQVVRRLVQDQIKVGKDWGCVSRRGMTTAPEMMS